MAALDNDVRSAIRALLSTASIEVTPREALRISSFRGVFLRGTRVYITHIPGFDLNETIATASRLHADEMVPVPHIAARRLGSREEATNIIAQLQYSGCGEALVVAGGDQMPAGPFKTSLDLLQTGLFERFGFEGIGVAGYPEGSPAISDAHLWEALIQKNEFALRTSMRLHIVTQFCFDSRAVVLWEKEARARGNRLPIHVGVPGLASVSKLLKFAAICGVGPSVTFLKRGFGHLFRLATRWHPDEFIAAVAASTIADRDSLIRQFHFYPFGAIAETIDWIKQAGENSSMRALYSDRIAP